MELGLFFMPVHRPEKPWQVALEEDRQAALLADQTGYREVWMGEHFSTKVEQVPSPLMFLATLIHQTRNIKFGTGVINLGHRSCHHRSSIILPLWRRWPLRVRL